MDRYWLGVAGRLVAYAIALACVTVSVGARIEHQTSSAAPKSDGECGTDYLHVIANVEPKPILEFPQLLWIAAITNTYGSAGPQHTPQMLVWGLGHDSKIWHAANCKGRTAFVEENDDWIREVKGLYPYLEIHQFSEYKATVGSADSFFNEPWLLDMPTPVQQECWDVVLVDAPMGYLAHQYGRMEAAYWTMQMAVRCANSRGRDVVVFMHDVEREVESAVVERYFLKHGQLLGRLPGNRGELLGVKVSPSA